MQDWFLEEDLDEAAENSLTEIMQHDAVALMAWDRAKGERGEGKGESKGKASKCKGKHKNSSSLEERKKRLKELKSRTSCQACG